MHIENVIRLSAIVVGGLAMACIPPAMLAAADAKQSSPFRVKLDGMQLTRTEGNSNYQLDRKYRPAEAAAPARAQAQPISQIMPGPPPPPLSESLSAQPFSQEIAKAAAAASIDPVLVHAVIYVESRYRPKAVSLKGAIGLMQVLPDTAARYGVSNPAKSPQANLKAGTLYLSYLVRTFGNRLDLALAAYNAGEGAVLKYSNRIPPFPETQQYVRDVLAKYNEWHNIAARRDYYLAQSRAIAAEHVSQEKPAVAPYLSGTRLVQSEATLTAD